MFVYFISITKYEIIFSFMKKGVVIMEQKSVLSTTKDKESKNSKKPKVGIALGGGGSFGLAHIGVLKVLEENNIEITHIAGTSMGAIVGALYSYGLSVEKLEEIAKKANGVQFFDVNIMGKGFLNGRATERILARYLPKESTFLDLKKEYRCVAVNLLTGKEKVFKEGPLFKAVRASYSVPIIFEPVKIDNEVYVDGGLLNNVPDNIVKDMGADIIIGVNVVNSYEEKPKVKSMADVAYLTFLTTQMELLKNRQNYSHVMLTPELNKHRQYQFNKNTAEQIIAAGEKECERVLPDIIKLIDSYNK